MAVTILAKKKDDGIEIEYLYDCDPEKNTKCRKTGCKANGGLCRFTSKEECSTNGKKYVIDIMTGEPMEVKGETDEGKLIP